MTFFTKRKQLFILIVVIVIFFFLGQSIMTKQKTEFVLENNDADTFQEGDTNIDNEIYIHICGSVENPGVYKMNASDRICDVIEKAGGFRYDANREILNLAEILEDEQKIEVPSIEFNTTDSEKLPKQNSDGKICINTANQSILETLPGIGEKKALLIVEYRKEHRFKSIDELKKIKGIGEKTYEKLMSLIKI